MDNRPKSYTDYQEWDKYKWTKARHEYNAVAKLGFLHLIVEDPVMANEFGDSAISYCQRYFELELDAGNELSVAALISSFSFCYDYCYDLMSDSLRQAFRNTIKREMDYLVSTWEDQVYGYWCNNLPQENGALGLAAIVLDGEQVQGEIYDGKAMWDTSKAMINRYLRELYDTDGAGFEGTFYSSFGLSGAIPFMEALKRKTGEDMFHQEIGQILTKINDWMAYEILPEKHKYNNLNDAIYWDFYPGVVEWIDSHWGYSLWLGPLEGIYNDDPVDKWAFENLIQWGDINRRTSECGLLPLIILKYNDDLPSEDPAERLPLSKHFRGRGLVYFRTGWEDPEDIMFSFESGPAYNPATGHYSVRHRQMDKTHFTLYAYGEKFAKDFGRGPDKPEDHNTILVDGKGQAWLSHWEKSLWSTGVIEEQISGEFCDYVHGDATDAYNRLWVIESRGTTGQAHDTTGPFCNPVLNADRMATFVRGDGLPPYFVIADDINKDSTVHEYQWLLHTSSANDFDCSGNPIVFYGLTNDMNIYVVSPSDFDATCSWYTPAVTCSSLFSDSLLPNTTKSTHPLLRIYCDAVNPYYQLVLFPHMAGLEVPTVTADSIANGRCAKVTWSTATDYNILKTSAEISEDWLSTNAKICLIREDLDSAVTKFMMAEGTDLKMRDRLLVDTFGDTGSVINSGAKVVIRSKNPNQFKIYAPEATEVGVNGTLVAFYRLGNYVYYPGVAGNIDEDATISELLYVSGDVTVDSGVTLTIQPGATLKFASGTKLTVEGALGAEGTEADQITFTSAQTSPDEGDWMWIEFSPGCQSTSVLRHCVVEWANVGIWCNNTSPTLDNNLIQHCSVAGIQCDQASPLITNNTLKSCVNGAEFYSSNPILEGNHFIYNDANGIELFNSYSPGYIIKDNKFNDNDLYGILLDSYSSPTIYRCEIKDNDDIGVMCINHSSPDMDSCRVQNNGSTGLYCSDHSSPILAYRPRAVGYPEHEYNWIILNGGCGVYAKLSSYPDLGSYHKPDYYPGNNCIHSNTGYEVVNDNSSDWIWAQYNYWGYPPPDSSDFSGLVIWEPYLFRDPHGPIGPLGKRSAPAPDSTDPVEDLTQVAEEYEAQCLYEEAMEAYKQVVSEHPAARQARYALNRIILCYQNLEREPEVVPYLENVAQDCADTGLRGFALEQSVYFLQRGGEYGKALTRCDCLMADYEESMMQENLLFQKGLIYRYGLRDKAKAGEVFSQFLRDYSNNIRLPIAQIMLGQPVTPPLPKQGEEKAQVPDEFSLSQNYPNPFNPVTTIRYTLPEDCWVRLEVFNPLGRKVATLMDGFEKAGFKTSRWDAEQAACGIYFYRLKAGDFTKARKMILLK